MDIQFNQFNEDCLLTMQRGIKVDVIITSPPYNTSRPGNSIDNPQPNIRYDDYDDMKTDTEYIDWTVNVFSHIDKILQPNGVVLYNLSYSSENTWLIWLVIAEIISKTPFTTADVISWKKKNTTPNSCSSNKLTRICEFVFVFCRKSEFDSFICNKELSSHRDNGQANYKNVFNYIEARNNDGSIDINKATFSSELVRKLLRMYAPKGAVVYDPFSGTGTTAVGCIIEGYTYYGSELSAKQVEIAKQRIQIHLNQPTLFQ